MVQRIGTTNNEDLIGSSSDDLLDGRIGQHRLYGLAGRDLLYGGAFADILDGGTGQDTMYGGAGDDLYRVDDSLDEVNETSTSGGDAGGIDTVEASISYSLGVYIEKLSLTGSAAIDGTGNELANRIKGNLSNNALDGKGGADIISGQDGNDTIIGGAGKDTLDGGNGADIFVFGRADPTSTDRISDFSSDIDRLGIFALDYLLREGHGLINGALDDGYFQVVSGFNPQGTASGHGQFLYNTSNFTLSWDQDGSGTAYSGVALAVFSVGVPSSTSFSVTDNNSQNAAPVAPASANFVTNLGVATPSEAINATDPNGDILSYALASSALPQHGIVEFNQAAGTFTYTPVANYAGTDSFSIAISDAYGGLTFEAVSITMKAFPPLPVAHSTAIARPAN